MGVFQRSNRKEAAASEGERIRRDPVRGKVRLFVGPCRASRVGVGQGAISRDAILSPSSRNRKRRSTGLPGKVPVSRQVTTVLRSSDATSSGSIVKTEAARVWAIH